MKNKKVLIIFKYPRGNWNNNIINKFSNYYKTEYLYLSDYKNKNFTEIIIEINNLIKTKNITIIVFDVDYFKFLNLFFINKINCKTKIIWTGDDFELHEMNAITASACDIVLSHCPLSVLKYQEKGYDAYILDGENTKLIKKNNYETKDIDVLFFGDLTPDRRNILNYIVKEGINLKNVGHDKITPGVSDEELLKLASKSKIILNFSKSRSSSVKNFSSENVYKFYYQYKGRILMAGFNGVACVSEYSPGIEIFFSKNEVLTFYTKEECVKILKELLASNELLEKYTNKFVLKVQETCNEFFLFEPIYQAIEQSKHKKVELIKIPYWYLRIAAKHIILRNIKLSTLIKAIFQFNVIFAMIKNSNILVKFFILIETLLNVLWYSFILTIKTKK